MTRPWRRQCRQAQDDIKEARKEFQDGIQAVKDELQAMKDESATPALRTLCELETEFHKFKEDMAKTNARKFNPRSASWGPTGDSEVDEDCVACIGGFKPFSEAGTVNKFSKVHCTNAPEDSTLFAKTRRVSRCYARFKSPDERLEFFKTRLDIEKDGRRLWVDWPKSADEQRKSKSVSKLVKVLKDQTSTEAFNKDMVDRVYGPGVVLIGDEVVGEWKKAAILSRLIVFNDRQHEVGLRW